VDESPPNRARHCGRDQGDVQVATTAKGVDGYRRAPRTTGRPNEVRGSRRRGGRSVGRRGGERITARPRAAPQTRPRRHMGVRRVRGRTPTGAADNREAPRGRGKPSTRRKERREARRRANCRPSAHGAADVTEVTPTLRWPPSAETDADGRRGRGGGSARLGKTIGAGRDASGFAAAKKSPPDPARRCRSNDCD
jgi:hypothetical protein